MRSGFQGRDPGEDGNGHWVWKSAGACLLDESPPLGAMRPDTCVRLLWTV